MTTKKMLFLLIRTSMKVKKEEDIIITRIPVELHAKGSPYRNIISYKTFLKIFDYVANSSTIAVSLAYFIVNIDDLYRIFLYIFNQYKTGKIFDDKILLAKRLVNTMILSMIIVRNGINISK